ncbi:DUF2512 family protein [Thermoactinomyces vulgaris]|nr:DUF2512 family protein [Thermoactinomyces vulgaris]QCV54648.1 DUF2512 family protein [Thermoactinomyces vulgaris]
MACIGVYGGEIITKNRKGACALNHTYHLIIKFIYVTLLLYLTLGLIYDIDYKSILFVSIVLALAGYLGDFFLLPKMGNMFTTLSDALLSFLIVWFIGTYFFDMDIGTKNFKINQVPLFQISLTAGILYAVIEWFYHRWFFKFLGKKEVF